MRSKKEENLKAIELYFKLTACLKKALDDEENLGCHINKIIMDLAKCIESEYEYYDANAEIWCDYFLKRGAVA